jgi:hypothetical protein
MFWYLWYNKEAHCKTITPMAWDCGKQISPEMATDLKNVVYLMKMMEEKMGMKLWMLAVTMMVWDKTGRHEADTSYRNGQQREIDKAEQRLVTLRWKLMQHMSCITQFVVFIFFCMFIVRFLVAFPTQTCSLVHSHLVLRITFHSGKYGSTL